MSTLVDLSSVGITQCASLIYNPEYDRLFTDETNSDTPALERAVVTSLGAAAIDTGQYTGRSPQDKYVVKDAQTEKTVWWHQDGSDNKPIDERTWQHLHRIAATQLSGKHLYVMDGFCGANPNSRIAVRLITEIAWQAHFFKNMFIRPSPEELKQFKPQWTILNACKTRCIDFKEYGLHSETFIAFDFTKRMTLIAGTWYGGEIKKGIFSVMNYWLPLQGIGSFHCSANQGKQGDTALFFGLSGTGKTTLSTDPKRALIGDDEHGWDKDGVFNLEGGCYAKTIRLSKTEEPEIYQAISRNALLENVVVSPDGMIDFNDARKTENTRVSYPIDHIHNIVKPRSMGRHPNVVIFLSCDAFGVLPPISKLTPEQAMYQFLSGYTARVAGTELGVKEPTAVFSTCFGKPFLMLPPTRYADILGQKIREHHVSTYLVNTGWCGGGYGVGKRISIHDTRAIIDAILTGDASRAEYTALPVFGFQIPTALPNVDATILNPARAWQDQTAYQQTARKVAEMFIKNFQQYTGCMIAQTLQHAGPTLSRER